MVAKKSPFKKLLKAKKALTPKSFRDVLRWKNEIMKDRKTYKPMDGFIGQNVKSSQNRLKNNGSNSFV